MCRIFCRDIQTQISGSHTQKVVRPKSFMIPERESYVSALNVKHHIVQISHFLVKRCVVKSRDTVFILSKSHVSFEHPAPYSIIIFLVLTLFLLPLHFLRSEQRFNNLIAQWWYAMYFPKLTKMRTPGVLSILSFQHVHGFHHLYYALCTRNYANGQSE